MAYPDLMLDLETAGCHSDAAILQIGAVAFNRAELPESELALLSLPHFTMNVALQSCLDLGLKVDESTFWWWTNQPLEAKNLVREDAVPLYVALNHLRVFTSEYESKFLWSYGADFDAPILKNACRAAGCRDFYTFDRQARCLRTVLSEAGVNLRDINLSLALTPHYSYHDCLRQIWALKRARESLGRQG